MNNEDLTPQLSKMSYEELLEKIRGVRRSRSTPSKETKPKKKLKAQKTAETKLEDMLEGMSDMELALFVGRNKK